MYNMIFSGQCNARTLQLSITYGPPIPYMECRNLIIWSPTCMIWFFWTMQCGNLVTVNDSYGSPIPYMEYGNLVTVNDSYGAHTLYGIWEPCNWVLPHVQYDFFRTMQCGNLVTVNDLWLPIPHMEWGNLVTGFPHMYNMITINDLWSPHTLYRMQEPCNWVWGAL